MTLLNKVTEGERNEQRQSDRRYEEDRRSDSLKRYKGMFDFLCPELSAPQNNLAVSELRLAQIMISNTVSARTRSQVGREKEKEVRQEYKERASLLLAGRVRLFSQSEL